MKGLYLSLEPNYSTTFGFLINANFLKFSNFKKNIKILWPNVFYYIIKFGLVPYAGLTNILHYFLLSSPLY